MLVGNYHGIVKNYDSYLENRRLINIARDRIPSGRLTVHRPLRKQMEGWLRGDILKSRQHTYNGRGGGRST